MKLSDAILLGAAITEPKPNDINHCALGMAANAMGIVRFNFGRWMRHDGSYASERMVAIGENWPWLFNTYGNTSCWNWIAETFNTKVCPPSHIMPTMTLEELVAEVREMEAMYAEPKYDSADSADSAAPELSTESAADSVLTYAG